MSAVVPRLGEVGRHDGSGAAPGNRWRSLQRFASSTSWPPLAFDSAVLALVVWSGTAAAPGYSPEVDRGWTIASVASAVLLQVVCGWLVGLYRGRAAPGSFDEVLLLLATVSCSLYGVLTVAELSGGHLKPVSVLTVDAPFSLFVMILARLGSRLRLENAQRRRRSGCPTIVFGAGEAGHQAIRLMLRDPNARYHPVALLDDDPRKKRLRLMGIPVMGGMSALPEVASRTGARMVLAAVPSGGGKLLGALRAECRAAGLDLKALPSLDELESGLATVGDIRDVRINDVLGRPPSSMELQGMSDYLPDKRVLVTGAGGSIGSELCRALSRFSPERIVMLDRDESALHAVQLSMTGRALLDSSDIVLADIRDQEHLRRIFHEHRPEIVFHAAALKHLPLLERFPGEAVKTNVWGTLSVLAASEGVERFVNISTDKAADPISVLGWSKRVAERVTSHGREGTVCVSVRFGNVLGSRGSVLHTFVAQANAGGPITVTHEGATRYFMTVTEAVHLLIAAGGIGRDQEALVLDMGEQASILDLARHVCADNPVPIEFTGLRPGEKLHEQLFGSEEVDERLIHPLISHVKVPPVSPALALTLNPWDAPGHVIEDLVALAQHQGDEMPPGVLPQPRANPSVPRQRSGNEIAV